MATGKTAKKGREIAGSCRANLLKALQVLEDRGKPVSVLLADAAEKDPLKFMDLCSKFIPRNIDITQNVTVEHSMESLMAQAVSLGLDQDTLFDDEEPASGSKAH